MTKRNTKYILIVLKSIALSSVFLLFAGVYFTAHQALNIVLAPEHIFRDVGARTYKILNPQNPSSGGTGFVVALPSGSSALLTNKHVCDISSNKMLLANRGSTYDIVQVIEASNEDDLCLVSLPFNSKSGLSVAHTFELGKTVFAVGHPRLNPLTLSQGIATGRGLFKISYCEVFAFLFQRNFTLSFDLDCVLERDAVLTTMHTAPGSSGSATVDIDGNLVGVIFAGSRDDSLIVPLDKLQKFLEGR